MNEMKIGTRVFVWGRPETNLILLFGEGTFEGYTFVNGNNWPTIRLVNGREITVHQTGIAVGVAEQVAETCKRFQGDVIEWDIDAYLRGERPSIEQRRHQPNSNSTAMPVPKTASDRVLNLKKEIELQESKIKVAEKIIAEAKQTIEAKKKEISDQTQSVIAELSAVNPDFMKQLAAQVAALQGTPQPAPPQVMAPEQPVMQPIAAAPPAVVRLVQPAPQFDTSDADSIKAATED